MSLRRSHVPIVIDPALGRTAKYCAGREPHIVIGAALYQLLTREEAQAVIAHEIGHRELYHVERCWAALALGYAASLVSSLWIACSLAQWCAPTPWWILLPGFGALWGFILAAAMRMWHELEADDFAMRTFGARVYRSAIMKALYGTSPSRFTKIRLARMLVQEARGV